MDNMVVKNVGIRKGTSLIVSALISACFLSAAFFSVPVFATDNDNLNVTCYGSYLELNIINASWDIGVIDMSTSYWTNETSETQDGDTYNCTPAVMIDFSMVISAESADWNTIWRGNESTGANLFSINASSDVWVASNEQLNLTTYYDIKSNFDPANNVTFDLKLKTPTSTTTGALQTIVLNGKVEVH